MDNDEKLIVKRNKSYACYLVNGRLFSGDYNYFFDYTCLNVGEREESTDIIDGVLINWNKPVW